MSTSEIGEEKPASEGRQSVERGLDRRRPNGVLRVYLQAGHFREDRGMKCLAAAFLLFALSIPILADFKPVWAQEDSGFELPEPQLEVPVDIDGDGESTLGDLYFFN
jgi:hypothetical protein